MEKIKEKHVFKLEIVYRDSLERMSQQYQNNIWQNKFYILLKNNFSLADVYYLLIIIE